jgi:predicted O-methyltransferase YrrM
MIEIVLDKFTINQIDLSPLKKYADWKETHVNYFIENSGIEHYKLIAFIAHLFSDNSLFIDIGTYSGYSALALSLNDKHKVVTYDIYDHIPDDKLTIKNKENITVKFRNCLNDLDTIKNSHFIVLDIDPHDGQQEIEILEAFEKINWKGIVILDDINKNQEMRDFFDNIKHKKYDISKYGHFAGSGLVIFDPERYNIKLNSPSRLSS